MCFTILVAWKNVENVEKTKNAENDQEKNGIYIMIF